ncbi:hypothetical protein H4Q26_017301 [Puccinia striiformis f. sp. tritici PST-130]|nr:hypothetical protein H4Q26_017301 [Puccinia striiformis f. sp. tritici PST-130]
MDDEDMESVVSSSSGTSIVTSDSESSTSSVKNKRGVQVSSGYQSIAPSSTTTSSSVSALNVAEIGANDLWVIRLPKGVKAKHLAGLQLDLSGSVTSSLSHGPCSVGEVKVGDVEYEIFAEIIPSKNKHKSTAQNSQVLAPETNEISQFTPLLPNQRKNRKKQRLYLVSEDSPSEIISHSSVIHQQGRNLPLIKSLQHNKAPQRISRAIFFRRRITTVSTKKSLSSILTEKTCVVTPTTKRPQPPGLELRNIPLWRKPQRSGALKSTICSLPENDNDQD